MNAEYEDIRSRIAEPPSWFDERAVPRYGKFHPRHLANIYASEGVLMDIACQGCGHRFHVGLSFLNLSHDMLPEWANNEQDNPITTFAELIQARRIHYGDPPNIRCCTAGYVMNSIPKRILEYWRRETGRDWQRDPSLEIDLKDGWAGQ